MTRSWSLRARLLALILGPVLVVAVSVGIWALGDAERRAADRFDRSLLSTALAISRDIGLRGGDALTEETRDLLHDTSGGEVFYHVYAPDGVFVTGYATPPVAPGGLDAARAGPVYADTVYRGRPVRLVRLVQDMDVDGLSGPFTFSVWQDLALRDQFVAARARPVLGAIAGLTLVLAVVVWFGVRRGLGPLDELQDAIARRSPDDLTPIARPVPVEVSGIVATLNALLSEVASEIAAKDAFISDAAHQLRNPIAGALSLSEAVARAPDLDAARTRSADLVAAMQEVSDLARALLTLERARSGRWAAGAASRFDGIAFMADAVADLAPACAAAGVALESALAAEPAPLRGDPQMLAEALRNLVGNALRHGGPGLTRIALTAARTGDGLEIGIADDGRGLTPEEIALARQRFAQLEPSSGSGLGLPIATAIVEAMGGRLDISPGTPGLRARIVLPLDQGAAS